MPEVGRGRRHGDYRAGAGACRAAAAVVRHGLRLPQLPTVELAYSFGRRSNSRVVSELANYLADSLTNAGTMRAAPALS